MAKNLPCGPLKAKSVWDTEEEDDEYLGADMDANDYFMKIDPAGNDLQKIQFDPNDQN